MEKLLKKLSTKQDSFIVAKLRPLVNVAGDTTVNDEENADHQHQVFNADSTGVYYIWREGRFFAISG